MLCHNCWDHANGMEYSCCSHCRTNRKGFPSDDLELNKNEQCGECVCKVDPYLGMVVTRWKDSRVFQTISTVIVKGTTTVQQWTGQKVQSVESLMIHAIIKMA
eukprot:11559066-Ditylum_brightwellii.AAC.1